MLVLGNIGRHGRQALGVKGQFVSTGQRDLSARLVKVINKRIGA
jgi:hypothetical protein